MLRASLLVDLWLIGFLVAIVLQTITQSRLAAVCSWGLAPGWQREIAFWNIAIVALIFFLRASVPSADSAILPALALLSLMLGANHLIAAIRHPAKIGHWAGASGNLLGVVLYGIFLLTRK